MTTVRMAVVSVLSIFIGYSAVYGTTTTVFLSDLGASSSDGIGSSAFSPNSGTSIPTVPSPLLLDAIDGEAYSKNTVLWSVVGGQTILSFDSNLKRLGNEESSAGLLMSELGFRVDEAVSYELSGYLDATDLGATESGSVMLRLSLFDFTANKFLLSSWQWSANTHDEQFVAGGMGGDYENELAPGSSLTGNLIPGHDYVLEFQAHIATQDNFNPGDADAGASAVGNFTLKIGTVPEPSGVALGSIFAVLGLIRRRPGKSC